MADHMTSGEVTGLVRDIIGEQQFTQRNAEYRKRRGWLNRTRDAVIPGLDPQAFFHSPKPKEDGHAYADKFVGLPVTISVAAQAERPKAAERAQDMENLAYRWYYRWKQKQVFARALFDMATLNRGHLHLFLNRDVLPLIPQPEDGEDPEAYLARAAPVLKEFASGERSDLIDCEHVPAETVYWSPDRSVKLIAAQVPLGPLARTYAQPGSGGYLAQPGKGTLITVSDRGEIDLCSIDGAVATDNADSSWRRRVTLYIVESAEYVYHVLHDGFPGEKGEWKSLDKMQLAGCYKNVFGTPAIFDVCGRPTGQDHALFGETALIEGLYETEPVLSALGTMVLDAGIEAAQQQRTLVPAKGPEAAAEREKAGPNVRVSLLANKFRLLPPGYDLSPYVDQLPQDVLNAVTTMAQMSERYGFPRLLSNPEELDAKSGYDRSKAQESASGRLDPQATRWGDTLGELFRAAFTGVKTLGVDIPVRNLFPTDKLGPVPVEVQQEITVKADDIVDSDVSVSFDSKTQYAKIAEIETGLNLMNRPVPLMTETQFLTEVLRVDDPERWRRQRDRDRARNMASEEALKDAQALFQRIKPLVEGDALQQTKIDQLIEAATGQPPTQPVPPPGEQQPGAPSPVSVPTGPNTAMAPEPPPNPQAELSRTGGGTLG